MLNTRSISLAKAYHEASDMHKFLTELSGSYNLNPFEIGYSHTSLMLDSMKGRRTGKLFIYRFLRIMRAIVSGVIFGSSLSLRLLIRHAVKELDANLQILFLAYEDSWTSQGGKYYGELIHLLRKERYCTDTLYLDVVGEHAPASHKTLYGLLSRTDILSCLGIGIAIQWKLASQLLARQKSLKIHQGLIVAEKGDIFRIVLNLAGFKKMFAKLYSVKCIVSLLEGDTYNYCLAKAETSCRMIGYVHGVARPGQLSLYHFIKQNSHWELAVSDVLSERLLRKYLPSKTLTIVEHLRHLPKRTTKIEKPSESPKTILAIGGLDEGPSSRMFEMVIASQKKLQQPTRLILRPHPGINQKVIDYFMLSALVDCTTDLNKLILEADLVVVSATSSACLDAFSNGVIPYIYTDIGMPDLCPVPSEYREYSESLDTYMAGNAFAGPSPDYIYKGSKDPITGRNSYEQWIKVLSPENASI